MEYMFILKTVDSYCYASATGSATSNVHLISQFLVITFGNLSLVLYEVSYSRLPYQSFLVVSLHKGTYIAFCPVQLGLPTALCLGAYLLGALNANAGLIDVHGSHSNVFLFRLKTHITHTPSNRLHCRLRFPALSVLELLGV